MALGQFLKREKTVMLLKHNTKLFQLMLMVQKVFALNNVNDFYHVSIHLELTFNPLPLTLTLITVS